MVLIFPGRNYQRCQGFTLIELLVVIAIVAILAVVVVLTLNPVQLLAQSRDANRLSDLATINSAVNLYLTDQSGASGFSLGNASSVYLSLPDTSSSCANLGLPTTSPSGINYACVVSTSSRNTNSTGWLPVNFSLISAGSPLGSLPIDPTNQSSTGLYYTYYGNGTNFEATALFESGKNKTQYGQKPIAQGFPEVNTVGNSITINPLFNPSGLVGYWPMDEGTGSTAYDWSGFGNSATWLGTATGTFGNYGVGKVGAYAGATWWANPSNYSAVKSGNIAGGSSAFTFSAWINPIGTAGYIMGDTEATGYRFYYSPTGGYGLSASGYAQSTGYYPAVNTWSYATLTYDGTTLKTYGNGMFVGSSTVSLITLPSSNIYIGGVFNSGYGGFNGLIDDVRVYNRALSAAEIQTLYNAEK